MRAPLRMLALPALALHLLLAGCGEVWNDPYPAAERGANILYSVFAERPKHLDPAQSYASDESVFTRQVYEPPLQYHYLKRPYELIPLTATEIPRARVVEKGGVVYSVYDIRIKPGIKFQPHPGFVAENLNLNEQSVKELKSPYQLRLGTRELTADDYIYGIKRLAHPRLHSPIFGLMTEYIVGLKEYAATLKAADKPGEWLDLRKHDIAGVERVDAHTYRVTLKGRYPQFVYWLAMPFFAPIPWEADRFFSQAGMEEKNFTLDWWPVGTGPFMLAENDPNARMVLARNPNFRGEPYPSQGEPGDAERGLLADAGKTMPFLDKAVYTREREAIPLWSKFLQGYYDVSGIGAETFDQAVRISLEGEAGLSPEMEARGIRLDATIAPTIFYLGANWLDPVVGGSQGGAAAERARKLRQALAIAVDWEEYLAIFANGRGV
ncbi:MAG TPA: ABC transporter substrate-binding protein, partial [Burkholderiales bacterium]|nr:ABC transporter substrate-binding protein [Burkholderiales bacterium]